MRKPSQILTEQQVAALQESRDGLLAVQADRRRRVMDTSRIDAAIADMDARLAAHHAALAGLNEEAADDLETINEWCGIYRHSDEGIVDHVIRKLGFEGAFTPEALALIADEYRAMERRIARTQAYNAARRYEEHAQ